MAGNTPRLVAVRRGHSQGAIWSSCEVCGGVSAFYTECVSCARFCCKVCAFWCTRHKGELYCKECNKNHSHLQTRGNRWLRRSWCGDSGPNNNFSSDRPGKRPKAVLDAQSCVRDGVGGGGGGASNPNPSSVMSAVTMSDMHERQRVSKLTHGINLMIWQPSDLHKHGFGCLFQFACSMMNK